MNLQLVKQPPLPLPLPAITEEAETLRNDLVLSAQKVQSITTPAHNETARTVALAIREHLKAVESSRTVLTKPLLDGQRQLKRLAEDHIAPLTTELDRLQRLAATFLEAEAVRVAAEEKARAELAAEAKTQADFDTISNEPMPEMAKAHGQQFRKVLGYEVLDIKAVYAARPELCKLEISPSAVRSTCVPELPVPGLRLWWANKAIFTTR